MSVTNATQPNNVVKSSTGVELDYDSVIVGAGFGGIRALYEMGKLGLSARALEAGSDVGGTWYWNRYPGARTDSEAWAYCFSFSKEIQDEYDWPERMPTWNQVQHYISYVTDKFDLRKDIEFNTQVKSAHYNEADNYWTISTEGGESFTCRYFISAIGWFSIAHEPPFPGFDNFKGEAYRSCTWPKEPVDFTGKRIGIVGSGSTAVQLMPVAAQNAEHVYLFQRTPNYVLPGRNHPLDDDQRKSIKTNYEKIWEQVRGQPFAFPMGTSTTTFDDVNEEQIEQILEYGWEAGGFRYLFETLGDILIDQRSNDAAAEFLRRKIRAIVKDPETAKLLTPDYPFALKRPPLGNFYYEAFNRDNVTLVDVKDNPIEEITQTGIRTGTDEYDLDMIVLCIGFDAVTGPLSNMDVRGVGGQTVKDKWEAGPRTHLGITIDGFPNMFIVTGPQAPFANVPPIIESGVDWIGKAIAKMEDDGFDRMQASEESVQGWVDLMQTMLDATLLGDAVELKSWFMGANIPGKAHTPLFYFGGAGGYFTDVQKNIDDDFAGYEFEKLG